MIQARMYTGTARPPLTIAAATHRSRTSAGSRSKYSAMPPATPAHMRSWVLRISRRGGGGAKGGYGGGVDGAGWGWGGGDADSGPMHVSSCGPAVYGDELAARAGRAVS